MKIIVKNIAAVMLTATLLSACTADFEKMNTDPFGVSDEELKQDGNYVGSHYVPIMQSIYFNTTGGDWEFQVIQNLNADMFSGYMSTATAFAGCVNNLTYALNSKWNDRCWKYTYEYVMAQSKKAKDKCAEDVESYAAYDAINTVCRVMGMSRLVDVYGPIIYSKYGESMTTSEYDKDVDVYKSFFTELATASAQLKKGISGDCLAFRSDFDGSGYAGDMAKWAKLCNSLRLRLAMRVVKYDADWAKKEAEAAIHDASGLLTADDDIFEITGHSYKHPLYTVANGWGDCVLNASVPSIMGGMGDPRLSKFAKNNKNGKIVGIRCGVHDLDKYPEYKGTPSNPGIVSNLYLDSRDEPAILFTPAETYFLLAEAALRGWYAGGTAEEFYKAGVKSSFAQWGVSGADTYLESHDHPIDYVDELNSEYSHAAMSPALSPCYEDATTNEERLERIITQKWIATYPEGMNAWAEVRRTGYPKIFPILVNDSQGKISTEEGIRRLTYTVSEYSTNANNVAVAASYLTPGVDEGSSRIFWDVKGKDNF